MSGTPTAPPRRRNPLDVAGKFATPEDRRQHYRDLGRASGAKRLVLSDDDVGALAECYRLLDRVAARHPKIADPPPESGREKPAGGEPAGEEAA